MLLRGRGQKAPHQRQDLGREQRVERHVVDAERCSFAQLDVDEPGVGQLLREHPLGESASDAASPGSPRRQHLGRQVVIDDEVRDTHASARAQDAGDLGEDAALARRQVDDAV
ncbi:MAG: hypothetical protein ACRD0W_19415, partial [Acidimicrobiales bacterium]